MTLYIAIWGAVLGTVTFAWNIWKWRRESPRIVEVIEVVNSLWTENGFAGIRLVLRNRGGQKTTVEQIFLYQRAQWSEWGLYGVLMRLRGESAWQHCVGNSNPKTTKLPVVLDVNAVWEGFIPLELSDPDNEDEVCQIEMNRKLLETFKSGSLRYSIQCSHTSRRIRGLVRIEDERMRE